MTQEPFATPDLNLELDSDLIRSAVGRQVEEAAGGIGNWFKGWWPVGRNDISRDVWIEITTGSEFGATAAKLLEAEWKAQGDRRPSVQIQEDDDFLEQLQLLQDYDVLQQDFLDLYEAGKLDTADGRAIQDRMHEILYYQLDGRSTSALDTLQLVEHTPNGFHVTEQGAVAIAPPPNTDEAFNNYVNEVSIDLEDSDILTEEAIWFQENQVDILSEFTLWSANHDPFADEAVLGAWLAQNWPAERIREEYQNTLPFGAVGPDEFIAEIDGAFGDIYKNMPPGMDSKVRTELINRARQLQGLHNWTRRDAVFQMLQDESAALAFEQGILGYIGTEHPYGTQIREYIQLHDLTESTIDYFTQQGSSIDDFIRQMSEEEDGFARIFQEPLDPKVERAKVSAALSEKMLGEMGTYYGQPLIPIELEEQLFSSLAQSLGVETVAGFEAALAQIDNWHEFVAQHLIQQIEANFPGATERIDTDYKGDPFQFLRVANMPRTLYTPLALQEALAEHLEIPEVDLEAENEEVRQAINEQLANIASSTLRATIHQSLQNRLRQLAEVEGVSVTTQLDADALRGFTEQILRETLEGLPQFEEIELLATINTGGSLLALVEQIDGENLTLSQIVTQLSELEPVDLVAGEDREIAKARGDLNTLRAVDREAQEREDFLRSAEGRDLLKQDQAIADERTRQQFEDLFVRQPVEDLLSRELGKGFTTRNARLIQNRLQQEITEGRVEQFRLFSESKRDEFGGDSEKILAAFERTQPLATRVPDRDTLLGVLREEQAAQQFVVSPVARRRNRFGTAGR